MSKFPLSKYVFSILGVLGDYATYHRLSDFTFTLFSIVKVINIDFYESIFSLSPKRALLGDIYT